jgi:hypothetical protein
MRTLRTWPLFVTLLMPATALLAGGREGRAIDMVEKLGGRAERDGRVPGKPVVAVYLAHTKVADEHLKDLAALENLQTLDLYDTKVTDTGLKEVARLRRLRWLEISSTRVTDAGLP